MPSPGKKVCERPWLILFYTLGIVSYGVGCGEQGYPGAYTRTSCYLQWIAEQFSMSGTSSSSSASSSWSTPCPVSSSSANNLNLEVVSTANPDNSNVLNSNDFEVVDSSISRLFEDDAANILSRELPPEEGVSKSPQVESKKPEVTPLQWPFYHYIQPTYYVQQVNPYLVPANLNQHFRYPYFYH